MFEQSLFEIPQDTRNRKRWTAMLSFSLEATAVLVLLSFPLLHTEALPPVDHHIVPPYSRPAPDRVEIVESRIERRSAAQQPAPINQLYQPRQIPPTIDRTSDPTPPAPVGVSDVCPGCIPMEGPDSGVQNPVIANMLHTGPLAPIHRATPALVVRSSHMQEGLLIRQIKPPYPELAKRARIQGEVLLHAVISREGRIEALQVVSGHPLLVNAAVDAVKQWLYRPYLLNGDPVAVDTQITVNFTLNGQ